LSPVPGGGFRLTKSSTRFPSTKSPDDVIGFFENNCRIAKSKTAADAAFLSVFSFSEQFVSDCGAEDTLFGLQPRFLIRDFAFGVLISAFGAPGLWIVLLSKAEARDS
jgi:hypothetical protein